MKTTTTTNGSNGHKNNVAAKILVVDDEANIRDALTRILRLEGYFADEVESGNKALAYLANKTYDLMVLDIRMPEMDGLEVMKRVQKTYPELLVIILTGQATLESAIATTKSDNVVDYLLKPVKNEDLVNAVATALQKHSEHLRRQQLLNAAAQMLSYISDDDEFSTYPSLEQATSQSAEPLTEAERFVKAPPFTLDCQRRIVTTAHDPTHPIELTRGETSILACFLMHPNRVLSCYELVSDALRYETTQEEAESVIRPYIFRLRRKIEANPKTPRFIRTVRRKGYRFVTP